MHSLEGEIGNGGRKNDLYTTSYQGKSYRIVVRSAILASVI